MIHKAHSFSLAHRYSQWVWIWKWNEVSRKSTFHNYNNMHHWSGLLKL